MCWECLNIYVHTSVLQDYYISECYFHETEWVGTLRVIEENEMYSEWISWLNEIKTARAIPSLTIVLHTCVCLGLFLKEV